MIAPITAIELITCSDQGGRTVRMCFDVQQTDDKNVTYWCQNVPYEIGIKLKVGQVLNAPSEIGLDNDAGGGVE